MEKISGDEIMHTGVTMVVVCLLSLILTWSLFGRKKRDGWLANFFYWLKSTFLSASIVFAWVYFYDSEFPRVLAAILSFGLSAFLTLVRSQAEWVLM